MRCNPYAVVREIYRTFVARLTKMNKTEQTDIIHNSSFIIHHL